MLRGRGGRSNGIALKGDGGEAVAAADEEVGGT